MISAPLSGNAPTLRAEEPRPTAWNQVSASMVRADLEAAVDEVIRSGHLKGLCPTGHSNIADVIYQHSAVFVNDGRQYEVASAGRTQSGDGLCIAVALHVPETANLSALKSARLALERLYCGEAGGWKGGVQVNRIELPKLLRPLLPTQYAYQIEVYLVAAKR